MTSNSTSALPSFYEPDLVGQVYPVRHGGVLTALETFQLGIPLVEGESVLLLLIDEEHDFHAGSLPVLGGTPDTGAIPDLQRLLAWFAHNMAAITSIIATRDRHPDPGLNKPAIFNRSWWWDYGTEEQPVDDHPAVFTGITSASIRTDENPDGRFKPLFLPEFSLWYVQQLEVNKKKVLVIWPDHCIDGTEGAEIVSSLQEFLELYELVMKLSVEYLDKGHSQKTEHYSPFEADVPLSDEPQTWMKWQIVNSILNNSKVVVAGQALSHCLLEALLSLKKAILEGPTLYPNLPWPKDMSNIYALMDCSTLIALSPEFVEYVMGQLNDMVEMGLNLVTTDTFSLVHEAA